MYEAVNYPEEIVKFKKYAVGCPLRALGGFHEKKLESAIAPKVLEFFTRQG